MGWQRGREGGREGATGSPVVWESESARLWLKSISLRDAEGGKVGKSRKQSPFKMQRGNALLSFDHKDELNNFVPDHKPIALLCKINYQKDLLSFSHDGMINNAHDKLPGK